MNHTNYENNKKGRYITTWVVVAVGGSALIGAGIKYGEGASQKAQAAKIAKNNPFIPEQLPGQVKQATDLAAQNFTNGMPGTNVAQQGIRQNAANAQSFAAKGATSGGDILDAANKIGVQSQDAQQQLALQAASYKTNALGGYESALGNEAAWQEKLYKNNQLDPYLRAANTAASLQGAGSINEYGAIDDATQVAQTGYENYTNTKYKNALLAKNTTGGQPGATIGAQGYNAASVGLFDSPINTNQLIAQSQLSQYST